MADITGMLRAAAGATTAGPATDPNFNQTVLLLHGDGNQGANNLYNPGPTKYLAFSDNSDNNFPITVQGDAYGTNISPYQGNYSAYFDGTGDYLTITSGVTNQFDPGSAFTLEGWFYQTSTANCIIFEVRGNTDSFANADGILCRLWTNFNGNSYFQFKSGTAAISILGTTPPNNTWNHLAVGYNGTTTRLWINGVSVGTSTSSYTVPTYNRVTIGNNNNQSAPNPFFGYLSNMRFVKGTDVYGVSNTSITVPTTPLTAITNTNLLTCQSNRFVDNSTNNFTITRNGDTRISPFQPFTLAANDTGSGFFDGTGDYVTVVNNAAFDVAGGNFTIEGWFYQTSSAGKQLFSKRADNSTLAPFFLSVDTAGNLNFLGSLGTGSWDVNLVASGANIARIASWNHIAVTRSGNVYTLFVNGVSAATTTVAGSLMTNTSALSIGAGSAVGTSSYNGYISDFRFVKGTAVYTSNFTLPTAPVANVTNTQLLTCQYSGSVRNVGFIDSSPNYFPITRVGNTTQGTFSPFSLPDGYWSNFFDGVGDSLVASLDSVNIRTAFTIEGWCYRTSSAAWGFFGCNVLGNTSGSNLYLSESVGTMYFGDGSTNIITFTTSGNVPLNAWFHCACTFDGTTYRIFINGVQKGSSTTLLANHTLINVQIGNRVAAPGALTTGYICNFRVVKGTAVYTSAFTPPTVPLTAITNTSLLTCQSNRFVDNSTNAFAITRNGDVRVTPFSPFAPTAAYSPSVNGGSGYFDGTGDYLTIADNPALRFGTGNFTIQCWIYRALTVGINHNIVSKGTAGTNGWSLEITGSNKLNFINTNTNINSITNINPNEWTHIAVVREGTGTNQFKIYINGVQDVQATVSTDFNQTTQLNIGISRGLTNPMNGYIAGFKYVVGTAETITVPTAPPTGGTVLLNFTNAGIFDQTGKNALETVGNAQVDTNIKKYGTGSLKFDGTGDYLFFNGGENFAFGTGAFTIEFWYYSNNTGVQHNIYDSRPVSTNGAYAAIFKDTSNLINYFVNGTPAKITSTTSISQNTWYHIAVTRSGTSTKLFINGTQEGSTYTDSTNYLNPANRPVIGAGGFTLGNTPINGYLDDLRITKGVARYTANFTAPTKEFPDL